MTSKLNAQELLDGLLTVAGQETNSGLAETKGITGQAIQKIMANVVVAQQLDAEQEILKTRLNEKRLELDTRMAELAQNAKSGGLI